VSQVSPRIHFVYLIGSVAHEADRSFGWRLIGSNNRELGRGTQAGDSLDDAIALVHSLQSVIDFGDYVHVRDYGGQGWRWSCTVDYALLARSSRSFRRERESLYNAEAFHEAFKVASPQGFGDEAKLPQVRAELFFGEHARRGVTR